MSAVRNKSTRWLAGAAGAAAVGAVLVGSQHSPAFAASVPEVFAGFDNVDLLGATPRTNTLNVPAGAYAITAKAFVSNTAGSAVSVNCRLTAGANFDESTATVTPGSSQALALNVVHTTASPRAIVLSCQNLTNVNTTMSFIKIVATRVNAVSDVSM